MYLSEPRTWKITMMTDGGGLLTPVAMQQYDIGSDVTNPFYIRCRPETGERESVGINLLAAG